MSKLYLLLAFFLGSFFLRFYSLSTLPNGLYWDELDTGYQAYSLLVSGKDYFGNTFPLFPHSLSDFRTPVNLYLLVPIIHLFGLNAFSVRFVSAFVGAVSIILIYLLVRRLYNNSSAALFAAFFLGLSPWHLLFSRTALDGISLMLFFFLLGLIVFFRPFANPRTHFLAGFFFSLSLLSYSPAKLFVPLLIISLLIIYRPSLFAKKTIFFMVGFSILAIPMYFDSFFGASGTRFHDISIFSQPTLSAQVDRLRLDHQLSLGSQKKPGITPTLFEKMLYNKPILIATQTLSNYLSAFSTQFLFTQGDNQLRHSPAASDIGQLQFLDFVPLIVGFIFLSKLLPKSKPTQLLLAWLVLSPLPAALTRDGAAHAGRTFFLLPSLIIVIAIGAAYLKKHLPLLFKIFLVCYLFFVLKNLDFIFSLYRQESARPFNYGFTQIAEYVSDHKSEYDRIYIDAHSESALMAYLFTAHYPPREFSRQLPFQMQPVVADVTAVVLDNVYFIPPGSRHWTNYLSSPELARRYLLVVSADSPLSETISHVDTIFYPDGYPAFYLLSRK